MGEDALFWEAGKLDAPRAEQTAKEHQKDRIPAGQLQALVQLPRVGGRDAMLPRHMGPCLTVIFKPLPT